MGYAIAMGACFGCGKVIAFNPNLVPSIRNSPVCEDCIRRVNPVRIQNGLKPIEILPGAYEPLEEAEMRL